MRSCALTLAVAGATTAAWIVDHSEVGAKRNSSAQTEGVRGIDRRSATRSFRETTDWRKPVTEQVAREDSHITACRRSAVPQPR